MGRYIDTLMKFDEVNILLKYLYLSDEHTIEYENSMGTVFSLRMDDKGELHRKIIEGLQGTVGSEFAGSDMTHLHLMAIADQLKDAPAKEYPEHFKSRFEEIKEMTMANLALNMSNQRKKGNYDLER